MLLAWSNSWINAKVVRLASRSFISWTYDILTLYITNVKTGLATALASHEHQTYMFTVKQHNHDSEAWMRLLSTLEHGVCQLIRMSMDLISHQSPSTWRGSNMGEGRERRGNGSAEKQLFSLVQIITVTTSILKLGSCFLALPCAICYLSSDTISWTTVCGSKKMAATERLQLQASSTCTLLR